MKRTIWAGDVFTAFLHAALGGLAAFMWCPAEYYTDANTLRKLHTNNYGLVSGTTAWQDHLAQVLQALGLQRLMSESNIYRNALGTQYLRACVGDLLSF